MNKYCRIDLSNFKLTVDKVHNGCNYFKKGDIVNLNFIPKNICIIALHTALPYYFSLLENAWFRWEKNKNSVTAFCPIAETSVGMEIIKVKEKNKNKIMVKVKNTNNSCIKSQNLDFLEKIRIGPRAVYKLIPYIFYLENKKNNENIGLSISCHACKYGKIDILLSKK